MEATEVRLGNLVLRAPSSDYKYWKETTVNLSYLELILQNREGFKGIPLTSEILERCGFESHEPIFANSLNPYWAKDAIVLTYSTAPPENTYLPGIGFTHNGEYLVAHAKEWITTLHELQNFYKENRGTELIYKPATGV